jgi:hypothetical protein
LRLRGDHWWTCQDRTGQAQDLGVEFQKANALRWFARRAVKIDAPFLEGLSSELDRWQDFFGFIEGWDVGQRPVVWEERSNEVRWVCHGLGQTLSKNKSILEFKPEARVNERMVYASAEAE